MHITFGLTGAATEPTRLCRREAFRRPVEPFVRQIFEQNTDAGYLLVKAKEDSSIFVFMQIMLHNMVPVGLNLLGKYSKRAQYMTKLRRVFKTPFKRF